MYVAMSRARDELLISHAGEPSLYLEPLESAMDVFDAGTAATWTDRLEARISRPLVGDRRLRARTELDAREGQPFPHPPGLA